MTAEIERAKHIKFFTRHLELLPQPYEAADHQRMTLVYFCLSALDLLGALDAVDAHQIVEWVYAQQISPSSDGADASDGEEWRRAGFRGGPCHAGAKQYDCAHVAMTYTALCVLRILGDDLGRVNRASIVRALGALQEDNGSFYACDPHSCGFAESDMRFVFCAAAISFLLDDWSGVDRERAVGYVRSCVSYDGGIALVPGLESHGGGTYTALAALRLMQLQPEHNDVLGAAHCARLVQWCLARQVGGFQGRVNKDPDTCYAWWIGATLIMLGHFDDFDKSPQMSFLLQCQFAMGKHVCGGFLKFPDMPPDLLHSYYGVCWLSMIAHDGFAPLLCAIGLSRRAVDTLPPAQREALCS